MSVALVGTTCYRPYFQALLIPVKLVYALFLKVIGCLIATLGARKWGETLQRKAQQIDARCGGHLTGLSAFGRRFLVLGDNFEGSCRGSCYWFINQHLEHPEVPLTEWAKAFEEGAPLEAISWHRREVIPARLREEPIWEQRTTGPWPSLPSLAPGIYSFLIGFSNDANRPLKAHCFTLFKGTQSALFDPSTGLSEWADSDWEPLLDRIAASLRSEPGGFFSLYGYSYSRNS